MIKQSEHEKKGIAVAGSLIGDILNQIDTYPQPGMLTTIRDVQYNIGGTGNMILDLAKIDENLPVKVSGIVGLDDAGDRVMNILSAYSNIDIRNVTKEGTTATTQVMSAQDTKQRTFFFHPGAGDVYDESYIDWEIMDAKIFHLEYLMLMKNIDAPNKVYGTNGAKILHDARKRGMETSVDMVSGKGADTQKIVPFALKYTDYCIINEVEASEVTGIPVKTDEPNDEAVMKEIIRKLQSMGVAKWIVIHSPSVGYGYNCMEDTFVSVPSLNLPEGYIQGSTGAGDAYCSGILYGAYMGWTIEKSMVFATGCAACSLSAESGTDGLRKQNDIWKVIQKYGENNYQER